MDDERITPEDVVNKIAAYIHRMKRGAEIQMNRHDEQGDNVRYLFSVYSERYAFCSKLLDKMDELVKASMGGDSADE